MHRMVLASKAPARVAGGVLLCLQHGFPAAPRKSNSVPSLNSLVASFRHTKDYAQLSATPEQFDEFTEAVGLMQRTQPNYSADDLAQISVQSRFVQSEHDEFIKREHAEYLARSIPGADLSNFLA